MTHLEAVGNPTDLDFCPIMPTYGPPPVQFLRGEGVELFDRDDKRYLDFLSGLAVTSLGHAHPVVAEALSHQAHRLLHVSNLFATEHNAVVAQTLDRLIGGGTGPGPSGQTGQVFFCNSGAEANEAAIKIARKFGGHGRHVVVSAFQSFHGRTLATLHATGQPAKWETFQPLPEGFRHAVWDDLADLERQLDDTVAAVLLEPIQGEGGVNPATTEYFQGVRELCTERGILMMVDEVQTGLARTGRVVRIPALRRHARRRHHGQGPGQRRPDRCLLGDTIGRRGDAGAAITPPPTADSRWRPPLPGPSSTR